MTPDILYMTLAALAGGAIVAGLGAFLKSKLGQKVEMDAEAKAFSGIEKGIEWLADDTADDKAITFHSLNKTKRRELLNQARDKIAKL